MQIKIRIKTPPGQADLIRGRFGWLITGRVKPKSTYINKDKSQLIWVMEGSVRNVMHIQKKVLYFDKIMAGVLDNRLVRKACNKEDLPILDDMLRNHTKVDIIKQATAEEIVEGNTTWWDRVKEKWKEVTKKEETEEVEKEEIKPDQNYNTATTDKVTKTKKGSDTKIWVPKDIQDDAKYYAKQAGKWKKQKE